MRGQGDSAAGRIRLCNLQGALCIICALALGQVLVLHHLDGGGAPTRRLDAAGRERLAVQIRVKAAKLNSKEIDKLDAGISALSERTRVASQRVRPTTISQSTQLYHQQNNNASAAAYAQLQHDMEALQDLEAKLTRAATHEAIERDVAMALEQDRLHPRRIRPIPALGEANEWLSALHRLTETGRVRGTAHILELLTRLLALPPDVYVELSPGAEAAVRGGAAGAGDRTDGAKRGRGVDATWEGREQVAVRVESPILFLREHRLWRAEEVRHVHQKPFQALPALLRSRCKGPGRRMWMCKQLLGPHNVKQALLSRGLVMGVTNAILSSHTGTADLYLVRAALRAGFKPAIITTAYNRNFAAQDAYAVLPELAGAASLFGAGGSVWWAGDCYFGASALALQRVLQHFAYTLVAEDGKGSALVFVRNDLLPGGGEAGVRGGAHLQSLMSANWVAKVVRNTSALHAPCPRRLWVRVGEGWGEDEGGSGLDRVLLTHESQSMARGDGRRAGAGEGGGAWATRSSEHVPVRRRWKVLGEGATAGWAGSGGGSAAGGEGAREVVQHMGTLVRKAGVNGSIGWARVSGNAMVDREAKLREQNHRLLAGHLDSKVRYE